LVWLQAACCCLLHMCHCCCFDGDRVSLCLFLDRDGQPSPAYAKYIDVFANMPPCVCVCASLLELHPFLEVSCSQTLNQGAQALPCLIRQKRAPGQCCSPMLSMPGTWICKACIRNTLRCLREARNAWKAWTVLCNV